VTPIRIEPIISKTAEMLFSNSRYGSTVGYPSDSLASCASDDAVGFLFLYVFKCVIRLYYIATASVN